MYCQCLAWRHFYWSKLWHMWWKCWDPWYSSSSTASVFPAGTLLDHQYDICDGDAMTPGLPLHLPPMSGLQVLFLIYSVTYVAGVLGPLVFLFIYRQCLACRYCTWSNVWHMWWVCWNPGSPFCLLLVSALQFQGWRCHERQPSVIAISQLFKSLIFVELGHNICTNMKYVLTLRTDHQPFLAFLYSLHAKDSCSTFLRKSL